MQATPFMVSVWRAMSQRCRWCQRPLVHNDRGVLCVRCDNRADA